MIDPWVVNTIGAIALGVGSWFFKTTSAHLKELTIAVGDLRTEVAVLRAERSSVDDLKSSHGALEERVRMLESK